jgi:hypothetical protein
MPTTRAGRRGALLSVCRGARSLAADVDSSTLLVGTTVASGGNALHVVRVGRGAVASEAVYDCDAEVWGAAPLPAASAPLAAVALRRRGRSALAVWRLPAAEDGGGGIGGGDEEEDEAVEPHHYVPVPLCEIEIGSGGAACGLVRTGNRRRLLLHSQQAVHVVAVDAGSAGLTVESSLPRGVDGDNPIVAVDYGLNAESVLVATRRTVRLLDLRSPSGGTTLSLCLDRNSSSAAAADSPRPLRLAPRPVRVCSAAIGNEQIVAVGDADGGVRALDIRGGGGRSVWAVAAHAHWVTAVAVGPRGCVASGGTDGVARAWAGGDGGNMGTYPIHGEAVYSTAWLGAVAGFASCSFDGRLAVNAPAIDGEDGVVGA